MNTAPKAPRNTKIRGNGEGTIFENKRRKRWVVACFDYKGVRRTESFKKNDHLLVIYLILLTLTFGRITKF